jgi:hypothetical protein
MTYIADDYAAIAAAQRALEREREPVCPRCEGGGWECYGLGFADPHFSVCEACGNPEGLKSP